MVHRWTLTIAEVALRGRVDPDLFFLRAWARRGDVEGRAFRFGGTQKNWSSICFVNGGGELLLLMSRSIRMMNVGCFTASTFSSVESLSHLMLAPL
jgi:hypothetical protein